MLHVEQRFPSSFYAPHRWDTDDGCMPFRICWAYFSALQAGLALDAITLAQGIGLAFSGEEGREHLDATVRRAFPPDVEG